MHAFEGLVLMCEDGLDPIGDTGRNDLGRMYLRDRSRGVDGARKRRAAVDVHAVAHDARRLRVIQAAWCIEANRYQLIAIGTSIVLTLGTAISFIVQHL